MGPEQDWRRNNDHQRGWWTTNAKKGPMDQLEETVLPIKNKRTSKKKHAECSSKDGELLSPHIEEMGDQFKNGDGKTLMEDHGGKIGN